MKLSYHNTFSTVDNKGTAVGHIRNPAEVNLLLYGLLPVSLICFILIGELELDFQRNIIGKTTLNTILNGILWFVKAV